MMPGALIPAIVEQTKDAAMDGHATHKVVLKILFDASISDKRASSKAGGTKAQEYIALLPNDIQAWCVEFLSKVNVWTLQHANTFFS